MNYTIYIPKNDNECEDIKEKYISWVRNSNEVSEKFKRNINSYDISVVRMWKQYRRIECNTIKVGANASEFSTTTYHVDAKFGNKIYSDGVYDYYRKEDYKPAHDETSWDLSSQYREIVLSKADGDSCVLSCGSTPDYYVKDASIEMSFDNEEEMLKCLKSSNDRYFVKNSLDRFDIYKDCVPSIYNETIDKYKALYGGAIKWTATVTGINDADIIDHHVFVYPVYEITIKGKVKKYHNTVSSLSCANFTAPQMAPQSSDTSYKNYATSIAISGISLVSLILAMLLSSSLGHKGLMQMYLLPMILMALASVVMLIVSIRQNRKKRLSYESAQIKRKKHSIKHLIFIICFFIGFSVATGYMYSITSDKEFFYTPEIVGEYIDDSGDYSKFTMKVESCDKEGNVVILHTFYANKTTHSAKWVGKIIRKTSSKIVVEMVAESYSKLPLNYIEGRPRTIEFKNNCSEIVYDFITLDKQS